MAESSKLAEAKVGAFVLAALAILILGTLWIAGSRLGQGRGIAYDVLSSDSGGIEAGDQVRFAGVAVGRVESVTLHPSEEYAVVFRVRLTPSVVVRTDSTASIATTGLLGSNVLRIEPGSPEAPRLPPGGRIHAQAKTGLERAMARADEVAMKILALMDQTAGILDQLSRESGPILDRVQQMVSRQNADNLSQILAGLNEALETSGPRVSSLVARLDAIAAAFGPDGARLAGLMDAGEASLKSASETLEFVGAKRARIEEALTDLTETISNLKAFSQQIKERPFSLVRIKPQPDRKPGQGVKDAAP